MLASLIGWAASAVLLATLVKQVYKLWVEGTCEGVSRWLFIGQITASLGFVVYSWLLHSRVFIVTNGLILIDAIAGALIVRRNRRRRGAKGPTPSPPTPPRVRGWERPGAAWMRALRRT